MSSTSSNADVRILRLKRWYHPQIKSIAQINEEEILNYGQYVSFNNYHFWDVVRAEPNDGIGIDGAYAAIRKSRNNHTLEELHVIQSIVLLGNTPLFWEDSPRILYSTMLQLSSTNRCEDIDFTKLEELVDKSFAKNGVGRDQWCLYHSLDFCDMVLFAKNISIRDYQYSLWDMTLGIPNDQPRYIRDTVTVYGISSHYVLQKYCEFERNKKHKDNHLCKYPAPLPPQPKSITTSFECIDNNTSTFGISVELSIQSSEKWAEFKQKIASIEHSIASALGRYDTVISFPRITLEQALYISFLISCGVTNSTAFNEYRIIPLVEMETNYSGHDIQLDSSLYVSAQKALDKLTRQAKNALFAQFTNNLDKRSIYEYGAELKRSLLALLKSGFSEEFPISVLHSFSEYLKYVQEKAASLSTLSAKEHDFVMEELVNFRRDYFNGLSMLNHCTMHTEKQFIQAPSFNAVICDIPPKLLAFYTGIADMVNNILNDENENKFSFLFVPDFRNTMYVKPIASATPGQQSILIIYLNEELFYSPRDVIPIVCHEIAHYVGNYQRQRKRRAHEIFKCIFAYLIYSYFYDSLYEYEQITSKNELVSSFANTFAEELSKEFLSFIPNTNEYDKPEKYYLSQISDFFYSTEGLLHVFHKHDFEESIIRMWAKSIPPKDVEPFAQVIDQKLNTRYLTKCAQNEVTRSLVTQTIASSIYSGIKGVLHNSPKWRNTYYEFYRNLKSYFSEAYSDLVMLELLNDKAHYEHLLSDRITKAKLPGELKLMEYWRKEPVCEVLYPGTSETSINLSQISTDEDYTNTLICQYVKQSIKSYLQCCTESFMVSNIKCAQKEELNTIWSALSDIPNNALVLRKVILSYKEKLITYFDAI